MPKRGVWFLSPELRGQEGLSVSLTHVCVRTLHTLGLDSRAQDPLRQVWPAAPKETGFSFLAPSAGFFQWSSLCTPDVPRIPFSSFYPGFAEVSDTKTKSFQRSAEVSEVHLSSSPVRVLRLEPKGTGRLPAQPGTQPAPGVWQALSSGQGKRELLCVGCQTAPSHGSYTAHDKGRGLLVSGSPGVSLPLPMCGGHLHWVFSSSGTVDVGGWPGPA